MNDEYKGDWLKRVLSYTRSSENLKDCEPFEQLNQKYILLQKQYADSFSELRDSIEPQAVRREYSKGGLTLHRGFYSPSALDLVFKDVFGRSLGKRLMGIRITEGGKAPKVWKRIVRNLSTALWDVEFLVFLLRSDHRKLMDVLLGLDVVSDTRE